MAATTVPDVTNGCQSQPNLEEPRKDDRRSDLGAVEFCSEPAGAEVLK